MAKLSDGEHAKEVRMQLENLKKAVAAASEDGLSVCIVIPGVDQFGIPESLLLSSRLPAVTANLSRSL
jgi:hypothetical protein